MSSSSTRLCEKPVTIEPESKADIVEKGYFSWAEAAGIPPHFDIMQPD